MSSDPWMLADCPSKAEKLTHSVLLFLFDDDDDDDDDGDDSG
jgi:hypothetical protein